MSTFWTVDNLPQVYTAESRDFQVFCRVIDALQNALKYDIDSIIGVLDSERIDNRLLDHLKTKVGFLTKTTFTDDELRVIIDIFPYLLKYKGSLSAISYLINAYFRIAQMQSTYTVSIGEYDDRGGLIDAHKIIVAMDGVPSDTTLLDEVIKYIIPTGYIVEFKYKVEGVYESILALNDSLYNTDSEHTPWTVAAVVQQDNSPDSLIGKVGTTAITETIEISSEEESNV